MGYEQDAIDARATLLADGQLVRVRVFSESEYDEEAGEAIRTHVDTNVPGAIFDFFFGAVAQTGTEIEKGDKRLYLASDVEISPGNVEIKVGSIDYQVVGMREVNPAGVVVLYDLHLRK